MRIVVVGLGKVGRALAAQLTAEKHDIVVVDQTPALIDNFVNIYDVRGVPGNGASYDVQKEAFENGADLLIATTSSDEINILACMVAKKSAPSTPLPVSATRNTSSSWILCVTSWAFDDRQPRKGHRARNGACAAVPQRHQARAVLPPAL